VCANEVVRKWIYRGSMCRGSVCVDGCVWRWCGGGYVDEVCAKEVCVEEFVRRWFCEGSM